jgi:hypothetical protein
MSATPTSGTQGMPGYAAKGLAQEGRRYFSIVDRIERFSRFLNVGLPIVLPLVVSIFSFNIAFAIFTIEVVSYIVGRLMTDFDRWYNPERYDGNVPEPKNPLMPEARTELNEILDRLHFFEMKYYIGISDMYLWLESGVVPPDNLDWMEMVSLLNRLSLNIGKHFEEDVKGEGK